MGKQRQRRSAQFKFQVAIEALKEQKTFSQLASEYDVHPTQIAQWKKHLLEGGTSLFRHQRAREQHEQSAREAELFKQIGRLKMELEWLKKKLTGSLDDKRALVESDHREHSIRRQCALLGLSRASFYYEPVPPDPLNLELMRRIDAQYLEAPFYGWPKMTVVLRKQGYSVNGKRVRRLMRQMGLQAITVRKRPATSTPGHRIYPYLLRDLPIDRPNQVWCANITYVPMPSGFLYLVAVMDWFSRYVVAWALSNSLEGPSAAQRCNKRCVMARP